MYMNAYQRYIAELLDEYGGLLESQLTCMVNARFKTTFKNLKLYIKQMCIYEDYECRAFSRDTVILPKGCDVDFTVVRSFEIMLKFADSIIAHNKSKGYISIRFFVNANEHNKEICIIPVREGDERFISDFVNDKFGLEKNEIVIFLLDTKEQISRIKTECNCKFAIVTDKGAVFFKR